MTATPPTNPSTSRPGRSGLTRLSATRTQGATTPSRKTTTSPTIQATLAPTNMPTPAGGDRGRVRNSGNSGAGRKRPSALPADDRGREAHAGGTATVPAPLPHHCSNPATFAGRGGGARATCRGDKRTSGVKRNDAGGTGGVSTSNYRGRGSSGAGNAAAGDGRNNPATQLQESLRRGANAGQCPTARRGAPTPRAQQHGTNTS